MLRGYFYAIINATIPFALGSILIAMSCIVKSHNEGVATYSKIIGVIVSALALLVIISNLSGMIGQYI